MWKPTSTLILTSVLVLNTCAGSVQQYEKNAIEIVSAKQVAVAKTEILYRPRLDSMYHCPGAIIQSKQGREQVSLIRCGIKEKCLVDVASERVDSGQWKILVPAAPENIDVVFSDEVVGLQR